MTNSEQKPNLKRRIIGFVLAPFAGTIRYLTLKIMKKMRPPGDKRAAIAASDHLLNELILPSVFHYFNDEKFREVANFKNLTRLEHDRIFNELQVAGIVLTIVYLRLIKSPDISNDFHFWQDTEEYLPIKQQEILIELGADKSNAKLMTKLIQMRLDEYEKLAEVVFNISNEHNTEFKNLQIEMKDFAAIMQAISIGTTDHIKRGKTKKGDPLIRNIADWLLTLYRKIKSFTKHL